MHDVDLCGDEAVLVAGAAALEQVSAREGAADVGGQEGVWERVGDGKEPGFVRDVDEACRGVGVEGEVVGGGCGWGCRVELVCAAAGGGD